MSCVSKKAPGCNLASGHRIVFSYRHISHLNSTHLPVHMVQTLTAAEDPESCMRGSTRTWRWWWRTEFTSKRKVITWAEYTRKHLFSHFYTKHMLNHPWHAPPSLLLLHVYSHSLLRSAPCSSDCSVSIHRYVLAAAHPPIARGHCSPATNHAEQNHLILPCC